MLLRRVRTTLAAARYFSAEAAAATKPATLGDATSNATNTTGRDTLGRRLLSLVYAKRSAVIAMRKWKEEGHPVRKYELNRIIRELRKHKRYKHAIEICEWMNMQDDIKLQPGDYAVHLDLIAKVRGLNSAEKFFEDLPDRMKGQPTCTALLHTYVQNKLSSKAEALMEKMSECGFLKYPLPYNHMLALYISNGQLDKVPSLIQELKKNASPDVVTYNLWLTACASQHDVETAEKIFLELRKAKIDPDWVTYSTLTSLYIRKSLLEKAEVTLKEMEKRISRKVRAAYSSLISLNTNMGNKDEVDRVWKKMKSFYQKMNDAEYTCMISSLLKLKEFEEAENLYTEWESVSGTGDSRVPNLLLAAYINKNQIELAEDFYNRMVQRGIKPSYTTWELLTWGYLKQKQTEKVLDYFKKAVGSVKKWEPDEKIIREVFRNLKEQGNIEGAEQLLITLRKAGHLNTEVYNLLLRTYEKAGKMPLIVAERMKKDKVELDDETHKLIITRQLRMDGWPALSIHGDKSQAERDWVLSEFKAGKSPIMTATDVAARGLDVKDVKFVINYDFPGSLEDYVHRIGRTGRAGAKGTAYTFFTAANARFAKDLISILEEAGQKVSPELAAMGRGAPPPPSGHGGFRDRGRGYGGGRSWS